MTTDPLPLHAGKSPLASRHTPGVTPLAGACINPPLEYRFRGLISDAQHLSVESRGRRVVSAPRMSDLPIAFRGRLLVDPIALSAAFTFVGGGVVRDEPYSFGFEIGNLWEGLAAGGWRGGQDALAGWWERPVEIRDVFHDRTFSMWLDPREQTGGFRWKQSERASDAPAWLDRSATGVITEAWTPCRHRAEVGAA